MQNGDIVVVSAEVVNAPDTKEWFVPVIDFSKGKGLYWGAVGSVTETVEQAAAAIRNCSCPVKSSAILRVSLPCKLVDR